jgi:hemerythrin superfamily protein
MATASHSPGKKAAGKPAATPGMIRGPDAVALLKADHRAVEKLFSQFDKARQDDRKKMLADKICQELRLHMQIEEEIFYPASRQHLKDQDIVDEAVVEHAAAKDLMGEIEHHVEEEETEYFPLVRKTDMDLKAVGSQMKVRKEALITQLHSGHIRAIQ